MCWAIKGATKKAAKNEQRSSYTMIMMRTRTTSICGRSLRRQRVWLGINECQFWHITQHCTHKLSIIVYGFRGLCVPEIGAETRFRAWMWTTGSLLPVPLYRMMHSNTALQLVEGDQML